MPALLAQLINGVPFDFSSIKITIATPIPTYITRIANVNYTHSLTPGVLRGTSAHKLARSRGVYEASGSMSVYVEEWVVMLNALKQAKPLTGGYMEKAWDCIVSKAEAGATPITDKLIGCRITEVGKQYQQGGDLLMVDVGFDIMKISEAGNSPVRDQSGIT